MFSAFWFCIEHLSTQIVNGFQNFSNRSQLRRSCHSRIGVAWCWCCFAFAAPSSKCWKLPSAVADLEYQIFAACWSPKFISRLERLWKTIQTCDCQPRIRSSKKTQEYFGFRRKNDQKSKKECEAAGKTCRRCFCEITIRRSHVFISSRHFSGSPLFVLPCRCPTRRLSSFQPLGNRSMFAFGWISLRIRKKIQRTEQVHVLSVYLLLLLRIMLVLLIAEKSFQVCSSDTAQWTQVHFS